MTNMNVGGKWQLGPRVWGPVVGFLGVGAVVLGLMVALGVNAQTRIEYDIPTCTLGEPGCENRPETHEHADFLLMIRGQQFDFGKPQFISTESRPLSGTVHIHDPRYTVLHIHRENTTWDEFWRSIGFELNDTSLLGTTNDKVCLKTPDGSKLCNTATETWKFYLNGVKVDGLANLDINDIDRALFSYGPETEEQVLQQVLKVSDQACIPSEICHARIPPGGEAKENCGKSSDTCR
ncbi:MAG: hypothetical protein C0506_10885 [Anaerolinea sp.]|nr:hypothetical protein [Anaerolinea sp.]